MNILIIGNGGREHAMAWKIAQSPLCDRLFVAPGNPGTASIAENVEIAVDDFHGIGQFCQAREIELMIVGPEAPLARGIVDAFRGAGRHVFGPTRAAAEIETSKRFAKTLMQDAGVPTAAASHHTDPDDALAAVADLGTPVVIKASGLAAGKGVIIARSTEEAERAVYSMLHDRAFGDAGEEILVEEFMEGEELSLFVMTDGTNAIPMLAAQDHKRLLDGDLGPNTGGMGAYAPVSIASPTVMGQAMDRIIEPTW